jgi:hypothetical protein
VACPSTLFRSWLALPACSRPTLVCSDVFRLQPAGNAVLSPSDHNATLWESWKLKRQGAFASETERLAYVESRLNASVPCAKSAPGVAPSTAGATAGAANPRRRPRPSTKQESRVRRCEREQERRAARARRAKLHHKEKAQTPQQPTRATTNGLAAQPATLPASPAPPVISVGLLPAPATAPTTRRIKPRASGGYALRRALARASMGRNRRYSRGAARKALVRKMRADTQAALARKMRADTPAAGRSQIFVDVAGHGTTTVSANPRDTVAALKQAIRDKEGWPCAEQLLVFAGRHLDDETQALEHYGIRPYDTVRLAARLPGGAKRKQPASSGVDEAGLGDAPLVP